MPEAAETAEGCAGRGCGRRVLLTAALAAAGSLVASEAAALRVFRGGSTTRLDDGPTALILRVRPRAPGVPDPAPEAGEEAPAGSRAVPSLEGLGARTLRLYNVHTQERLEATYWREGVYDRGARAALDRFLRDWRAGSVLPVAPGVLDILCAIYHASGASGPLHVLSGYRTPATNEMLAERDAAVARHSLHLQARAIDFHLPGYSLAGLREHALALRAGGVGYYPDSGFLHVDNGPVRTWSV